MPSFKWTAYSDFTYRDFDGNIILDLSNHNNGFMLGKFKNGKAPIGFYNEESREYYFTVIDEKGTFLFEPVVCAKPKGFLLYDVSDGIVRITFTGAYSPADVFYYTAEGTPLF